MAVQIRNEDSSKMREVSDASVDLVVTSPCYPMIKQWDIHYARRGCETWDEMHLDLNLTWEECYRVMKPGSIMCINIGDATRKVDGQFRLYPNHARITELCSKAGFEVLPYILWKKITTKPNKFMGSGMLPPNAYVTQDCEFILIFRKGGLREFDERTKPVREKSRYTIEERNKWFSQLWEDIRGAKQESVELGKRVAAFPEEIPYRLIRMFSVEGDTVLDPFLGTGTTISAAIKTGRNGIGYEIDNQVFGYAHKKMVGGPDANHS